jgi:hypothetical protein
MQGPGNYRDIAQNRRDDVTFLPRLASFDIQMFLSYIQADGYEPLTVEAVAYLYGNHTVANEVAKSVTGDRKSAEGALNALSSRQILHTTLNLSQPSLLSFLFC